MDYLKEKTNTIDKDRDMNRNFKTIKEYIDNIEEINHENCWLLIDNDDKTKYCLLKENDKFIIKRNVKTNEVFSDETLKYLNLNEKILSNDQNEKIVIIDSMFKSHNWIETVTYSVSSFESEKFRENMFFQLVVNNKEKGLRLDFIFENLISISTERYMNAFNGITFEIKDIPFNLYIVNDYFVIENLEKLDFKRFEQYCRVTLSCFGILTGYAPRNKGYYFSYENNQFENTKEYAYTSNFVNTYDLTYRPIDNNLFYSFMPKTISEDERNNFEDKAQENLFLISNATFSKLCNLNVTDKKISRATELIMEANQTSIEAQGVIYSVVLEILTSYIAVKNEGKLTPITDKTQAKTLKAKLHDVAKEYLSPYENSPISKKIDSINSPTNRDKLLKPFEFLDIKLNDIDKQIINHRNDFLHGNDFIEGKEVLEFFNNHFYINCKLNFLVYALLLKIIGHHGKIVNMVKIYLENDERVKSEEFYRDIGKTVPIKNDNKNEETQ